MRGTRPLAILAAAAWAAGGCAYYNSMWSADRFAKQARGLENRGRGGEARSLWLQASEKAESVLTHHPRSRWADDALVLRLEGLARGGDCGTAARYAERARSIVLEESLRQRADLAVAECALEQGRPGEAGTLAAGSLDARDARVRSRAAWIAAQAAWGRGDADGAIALYARSAHPDAGPARVHALLAAGQDSAALALFDSLAATRFREEQWTAMLQDLTIGVGAPRTSAALTRALTRTRVPLTTRLHLLLTDGDRLLAVGAATSAAQRYGEILASGVESNETNVARVRWLRATAQAADEVPAALAVRDRLRRYLVVYPGSGGVPEAQYLLALLARITDPEPGDASEFRAAELARDTLRAPALAGRRFVAFAARHPESLFAPKALVAALPLLPETGDSLRQVLQSRYGDSPYALALQGDMSPAFGAAEDSLAKDLGVEWHVDVESRAAVESPLPGPRGPWLEQVWLTSGSAALPGAPTPAAPRRLRPGERPLQRP